MLAIEKRINLDPGFDTLGAQSFEGSKGFILSATEFFPASSIYICLEQKFDDFTTCSG